MDLILQAEGAHDAVAHAHERAWQRFEGLLQELVSELPDLRAPVGDRCALQGVVARRMWAACSPYRAGFITSMAAVAGAVAQEILACYDQQGIDRAHVLGNKFFLVSNIFPHGNKIKHYLQNMAPVIALAVILAVVVALLATA